MSNKDEIRRLNVAESSLRRYRGDLKRTARQHRREDPSYEPPSVATRTYFAVSTTNAQACGWTIYNDGMGRHRTEMDFLSTHGGTDIYEETLRKNLRIVPRSGLRRFGLSEAQYTEDQQYYE